MITPLHRGHLQRVMSLCARNSSAARRPPARHPCLARPRPAGRSAATRRCRRQRAATVRHLEIIGAEPSRHVGDPDDFARRARRNARSSGRDRRRDRPHRHRRRRCRNCRSRSSAAHTLRCRRRTRQRRSERRGPPASRRAETARRFRATPSTVWRDAPAHSRDARQRAERQNRRRMTSQRRITTSHGKPATARAGPVSSRICMPVLARSTI